MEVSGIFENWNVILYKAMDAFVLGNSFAVKAPIIFRVLKTSSALGLSSDSLLFEIYGYGLVIGYFYHYNFPLILYAENLIKAIFLITATILGFYYKDFSLKQLLKMVLSVLFLSFGYGCNLFPESLYIYNQIILICFTFSGKFSQVFANFRQKYTGVQSLYTASVSLLCNFIRLYTNYQSVPDKLVLLNTATATVGNLLLTYQILVYPVWLEEKEKIKKTKEK